VSTFIDSFEGWTKVGDSGYKWSGVSNNTYVYTTDTKYRTGQRSLLVNPTQTITLDLGIFGTYAHFGYGAWFGGDISSALQPTSLRYFVIGRPTGTDTLYYEEFTVVLWQRAINTQLELAYTRGGWWQHNTDNIVFVTGDYNVQPQNWGHLQMSIEVSSAGEYVYIANKVYFNEVLLLTNTHELEQTYYLNWTTEQVGLVSLTLGTRDTAASYYDDFYCTSDPTLNGDFSAAILRPESDVTSDWTPSTGSDNYAMVDDGIEHDGDTTYNEADTVGESDLFELEDTGLDPAEVVYAAQLVMVSKNIGPGTGSIAMNIDDGGGVEEVSHVHPDSTYTCKVVDITNHVATAADLDNLQVGYSKKS
jgi:hypothetical protein